MRIFPAVNQSGKYARFTPQFPHTGCQKGWTLSDKNKEGEGEGRGGNRVRTYSPFPLFIQTNFALTYALFFYVFPDTWWEKFSCKS